jgi:NTE family protein
MPGKPGQIRGVSGASAGAITAMLLSLGCNSSDLKEQFSNKQQFTEFYDDPAVGECRGLTPQKYDARVRLLPTTDTGKTTIEIVNSLYELIEKFRTLNDAVLIRAIASSRNLGAVSPAVILALALGRGASYLAGKKQKIEDELPFFKKIFQKPAEYLLNLENDRGMFPGFTVRRYLQETMRKYIKRMGPKALNVRGDPANIDFATLKQITGIDLVISGTNISQRRSVLFSADNTPQFPVVEAVGISACYPVVFKPIYVKAPTDDKVLGKLRGLWIDGGLLNNFPIHAFDKRGSHSKGLAELNPSVLGFMLTEGDPDPEKIFHDPEEESTPFAAFAGGLLETMLTPGNIGQLRTPQERTQIIPLFTFELSLFEFSPSAPIAEKPLKKARSDVLAYFGK